MLLLVTAAVVRGGSGESVCVLRWMQCNRVTAGYSCCSKGWLGGECVCYEMDAV